MAGENVVITKEGNIITISATPTIPEEPDNPEVPDTPTPPEEETLVEYIINNKIPAFSGYTDTVIEVTYKDIDGTIYNEQGFYVGYKNGVEKTAGYQLIFNANDEYDT